jgi:uncharacterized protein with beta-barrel porin domain
MNEFLGLMLDPYVEGRSGIGGGNVPALGFAPEREDSVGDIALAYAPVYKAPVEKAAPFEQRWSLWGTAYGGYNHTGGDPLGLGSHDLAARAGGMAAGLDYRLSRETIVGMAVAAAPRLSLANGSPRQQRCVPGRRLWHDALARQAVVAALAYTALDVDRPVCVRGHPIARFEPQSFGGRVESARAAMALGVTPYAALQAQLPLTATPRPT